MCFTDLKDLLSQELRQGMKFIYCTPVKFLGLPAQIFVRPPLCTFEMSFSVWAGMARFGVAQWPGFPVEVSRVGYPSPFPVQSPILTIIQDNKICEILCYFSAPQ